MDKNYKRVEVSYTQTERGQFNEKSNKKGSGRGLVRSSENPFKTGMKSGIRPRTEEGDFMAAKQRGISGKRRCGK